MRSSKISKNEINDLFDQKKRRPTKRELEEKKTAAFFDELLGALDQNFDSDVVPAAIPYNASNDDLNGAEAIFDMMEYDADKAEQKPFELSPRKEPKKKSRKEEAELNKAIKSLGKVPARQGYSLTLPVMFDETTPLHDAAAMNDTATLAKLLAADQNSVDRMNSKLESPLLVAVKKGNVAAVNLLLQMGADYNMQCGKNPSALNLASEMVSKLKKAKKSATKTSASEVLACINQHIEAQQKAQAALEKAETIPDHAESVYEIEEAVMRFHQ